METPAPPGEQAKAIRADAFLFLAIAAAAFALRYAHLLQARSVPLFDALFMDGQSYGSWSDRIAAGDWIGDRIFYQAPLYPYFLAVVKLTVGSDLWTIRLVQIAIGSIACGVLFLAGRTWFSRRTGVVAGLILAFYPPAIFFDGLIQKANLGLLWTVLLLDALGRARANPSAWKLAIAGVWLGLLMLTREETILLAPVIGAWALLGAGEEGVRVRARPALGFVAGLAVVLLPVMIRNEAVGGELVLTTSQAGSNFYIGNNPEANGTYVPLVPGRQNTEYERKDAFDLAERDVGHALSPSEVSAYWFKKSSTWITAHPLDWLRLLGTKVALLVNWYEMPDAEDLYFYERSCGLVRTLDLVWNFGVLFPLAAAGLTLTFGRRRELRILHLLLGTLALGVVLFYVFARYRYPLVPPLILFAAAAIASAAGFARERKGSELGLAAIVLCLAAAASNRNLRDKDSQLAESLSNSASVLAGKGDDARAAELFRQSLSIRPDEPSVLGNLGLSLMRLHREEEAIADFRRAAELRAKDWRAWLRLGCALEQAGRIDEAEPCLVRALDLDPKSTLESAQGLVRQSNGRDLVALDVLAAAQAKSGRFDEAASTASLAGIQPPAGQEALAARMRERAELYRRHETLGGRAPR
jgi:4-amino-4-deoxy-L-arabinose transferase-like glycosyltransferase